MIRLFALALGAVLLLGASIEAEIRSWRVGDAEHPWTLKPVSGRIDLGRGWKPSTLWKALTTESAKGDDALKMMCWGSVVKEWSESKRQQYI